MAEEHDKGFVKKHDDDLSGTLIFVRYHIVQALYTC